MNMKAISRIISVYGIASSVGWLLGEATGLAIGVFLTSILVFISNIRD